MCGCLDDAWVCAACGMFIEYQNINGEDELLFFVRHEVEDEEAGIISSVWQSHTDESCREQRQLHWEQLVRGGLLDVSSEKDMEL